MQLPSSPQTHAHAEPWRGGSLPPLGAGWWDLDQTRVFAGTPPLGEGRQVRGRRDRGRGPLWQSWN